MSPAIDILGRAIWVEEHVIAGTNGGAWDSYKERDPETSAIYETLAATYIAVLLDAGYKVAPMEPTRIMVDAARGCISRHNRAERKTGRMDKDTHSDAAMAPVIIYRAMIARA